MRRLSCCCHPRPIHGPHADDVIVEDALLPAAIHLSGPRARDVLAPAVEAGGGELVTCTPVHVQYRPGSDLTMRFRAIVRREGRDARDTLLAGTTVDGPPPGSLVVEAEDDGVGLSVGVWRWPFDPVLTALGDAVTPSHLADLLGGLAGRRPEPEVVAYRPIERAVVRVRADDGGRGLYVKVVDPATTGTLIRRHEALHAAGLPVPRLLASGHGWIAMEAIEGPTLRDRLRAVADELPGPSRFDALYDRLGAVDLSDLPARRPRMLDAPAHAAMLARVLPGERSRLERIGEHLGSMIDDSHRRSGATVHGDLHEGQLVLAGDRIVGLLDIDDVGPGDPVDDIATMLGHLRYRAATSGQRGGHIDRYADRLRDGLADRHDPVAVDVTTAAVLVGLATGPFRIQQDDWQSATRTQLDAVERLLSSANADR